VTLLIKIAVRIFGSMKKILPLITISIVAATFFLAVNSSWAKGDENLAIHFEQAYVVEEINTNGEVLNTFKGNSNFLLEREIAIDLNASPYKEDKFVSFPRIDMQLGSIIKLYRAPRYVIVDGNQTVEVRSWKENVGELLSEKDIALGKDDKINFATSFELEPEMEIKIVRVAKTELVEEEEIDYKVIKKADPELDRGKIRVEQYGEKGVRELTYEVIRENGVEISRTLLRNEVIKEPVNTIKYFGTKVTVLSSVKGYATLTNDYPSGIVSSNYSRGILLRITNLANGKRYEGRVTHTWGSAKAPAGVDLDVGIKIWRELGYTDWGRGPHVLVEEIKG